MGSTKFWKDTAERVLATAVVAFAAAITGTNVAGDVDWKVIGWTTATAALGTLVKCVLASGKGDPTSASLVQ